MVVYYVILLTTTQQAMPQLSKSISRNDIVIKKRFDNHYYTINTKTYQDLIETVKLYQESIYLLPDYEVVDAKGADQENRGKNYQIKVNEIVFV